MRARHGPTRYIATDHLRDAIQDYQGSQRDIARRLGMSEALMSLIISGKRNVAEPDARLIAAIINGDFSAMFALEIRTG